MRTERIQGEYESKHRIKIYKELARLTSLPRPEGLSPEDERLQRQMRLAAARHPRWRDADPHDEDI
jgi:hypothetical protein